MRIVLLAGVLLMLTVVTVSAVTPNAPHLFNYQGRLTNSGGTPLPDGPQNVRFIIWRDSVSNLPLDQIWDSGPVTVTTSNGLFSLLLGKSPQPAINPFDFEDSARWVGVTVGADPELSPRTRLSSVPYAFTSQTSNVSLHAGTADYALNGPGIATNLISNGPTFANLETSSTNVVSVTITTPAPGYVLVEGHLCLYISGTGTEFAWAQISQTSHAALNLGNYNWLSSTEYANNSSAYQYVPADLKSVVFVPAGTYTFYLQGNGYPSNAISSSIFPWAAQWITATYFPNAYGTVITGVPPGGDNTGMEAMTVPTGPGPNGPMATAYKADLRVEEQKYREAQKRLNNSDPLIAPNE